MVGVGDDGFGGSTIIGGTLWRGTLFHSHVGGVGEATGGDGDEGVGGAGAGVFGSCAGVDVDGSGVGAEGVEGGEPPHEHSSLLQSTGLLTTG